MKHAVVVIDPFARTLTRLETHEESYEQLVGATPIDYVTIRQARKGRPGLGFFRDSEGLSREKQRFWCLVDHLDSIVAGRAVLCAFAEDGGQLSISPVAAAAIGGAVIWRDVRFAGFETRAEHNVEIMPGVIGTRCSLRVKFEPRDD